MSGCGAPDQAIEVDVDLGQATVISGVVRADGAAAPVVGAYVRLLDAGGEFVAEVVSGPEGQFRFFAAPGSWTVRALARVGSAQATVDAGIGRNEVQLTVSHS